MRKTIVILISIALLIMSIPVTALSDDVVPPPGLLRDKSSEDGRKEATDGNLDTYVQLTYHCAGCNSSISYTLSPYVADITGFEMLSDPGISFYIYLYDHNNDLLTRENFTSDVSGLTSIYNVNYSNVQKIVIQNNNYSTGLKIYEIEFYGTLKTDPNTPVIPVPVGFNATPGHTDIYLYWQHIDGVDGYNLYRDGVLINSSPISGTSYLDTELQPETTYIYTLTAILGEHESQHTAQVIVTTNAVPVAIPPAVKINALSDSLSLTWQPVPGATAYRIYKDGEFLAETTELHFRDTDVQEGVVYYYSVSSVVDGIESNLSAPVSGKLPTHGMGADKIDLDIIDVLATAFNFIAKYGAWITLVLALYFAPRTIGFLHHLITRNKKTANKARSADKAERERQPADALNKSDKGYRYLDKYGINRDLSDRERAVLDAATYDPMSTKSEMEKWRQRYREADATYERLTRAGRIRERDLWARANRYVRPEQREAWTRPGRELRYQRNGREIRGR